MKVALIGATGNVGGRILEELLERDHQVTAIARHPESIDGQATIISYEDFAAALIDELEQLKFIRRRFTVGY